MEEPSREPLWHVLSRSSEYALRAVLELATRGGRMTSATELAKSLNVPQRYLSHVLGELARAGILESSRGQQGGFRLREPVRTLTLARVISPFDAVGSRTQCLLRQSQCSAKQPCAAHDEWTQVAERVVDFFQRMTVLDLLRKEARPVA